MKAVFDSSAFAKRYVEEHGSQEVDDLCALTTELGLCVICVPEILSALNRRVREKKLSNREYSAARDRLAGDVADAAILQLVPPVLVQTAWLLEAHPLRAMDAMHVACALAWGAELFVSADRRQIKAAQSAGLRSHFIAPG